MSQIEKTMENEDCAMHVQFHYNHGRDKSTDVFDTVAPVNTADAALCSMQPTSVSCVGSHHMPALHHPRRGGPWR